MELTLVKRLANAISAFRFYGSTAVSGASHWTGLLSGTKYDYKAQAGKVFDNSVVSAIYGWYARQICYPRLIVQQRVKDESGGYVWKEIPNHPLPLAITNSPTYDETRLWSGLVLSLLINDGGGFWYKVRNNSGKVAGFQYVPHTQVTAESDGNNPDGTKLVTHFEYTPIGGIAKDEPVEDFVHFTLGVNIEDPRKGIAPITAVLREVWGENEASTITAALLRNAGITALVFSPKVDTTTEVTPAKAEEFKDRWRRNTTGDMAGTPSVLPFPIDVHNVGLTPDQLVPKQIRETHLSRICAAVGLDPMVLGYPSEQKTYANYGEALEAAYENALMPMLAIIAKQLTRQCLIPDYGGSQMRVWWDTSEVPALQDDEDSLWKRMGQAFKDGLITRADGRSRLGLYVDDARDNIFASDALGGLSPAQAAAKAAMVERAQKRRQIHEAIGVQEAE